MGCGLCLPDRSGLSLAFTKTLTDLTTQLANGLLEASEEAGIPLVVNHVGGMFGIFFTDAKTRDQLSGRGEVRR